MGRHGGSHPHLVVVGEHEARRVELDALGGLAPLAGHGVGAEEPDVLDDVDAADLLQRRVDLADLERAAPRPAIAVGPAGERVEEPNRAAMQSASTRVGVEPGPRQELGHDGDALVHRRLDRARGCR